MYVVSWDIEVNVEIIYLIISGNEYGKFSIDFKIGVVFIIENLDYESFYEYYLIVEVIDGGMFLLSDVVIVNVNVIDINDNIFVFS